jgi:hypothetical protein
MLVLGRLEPERGGRGASTEQVEGAARLAEDAVL